MSWQATNAVRDHSLAKNGPRLLLYAMASFADEHGFCHMSVETLVRTTKLDRRAVQRHLRGLEGLGELIVADGRRGGGRHRTTRYRIAVAAMADPVAAEETAAPGPPYSRGKGRSGERERADILAGKGGCTTAQKEKKENWKEREASTLSVGAGGEAAEATVMPAPPVRSSGARRSRADDVDLDALLADPVVRAAYEARGWNAGQARIVAEAWRRYYAAAGTTKRHEEWFASLAGWIEREREAPPTAPRRIRDEDTWTWKHRRESLESARDADCPSDRLSVCDEIERLVIALRRLFGQPDEGTEALDERWRVGPVEQKQGACCPRCGKGAANRWQTRFEDDGVCLDCRISAILAAEADGVGGPRRRLDSAA